MNNFEYNKGIAASDTLLSIEAILAYSIANYYNWDTESPAYPSEETLAKDCKMSTRSVRRALKGLVNKGYMTYTRQYNKPNLYTPVLPLRTVSQFNEDTSALSMRTHSPFNEDTSGLLKDNIKDNIKDKEKIINEFSNENSYRDSNNKKPRKKIIIKSETPALQSFRAIPAAAEIWEQTPENIKKFWQEQGI